MVDAGLVKNIRQVEPHQVDTASDQIALTMIGDVQLGQCTLLAGYLNPYMGLSLAAQGLLSTRDGHSSITRSGNRDKSEKQIPVSYTHLTLPTIHLV